MLRDKPGSQSCHFYESPQGASEVGVGGWLQMPISSEIMLLGCPCVWGIYLRLQLSRVWHVRQPVREEAPRFQ